MDSEVDQEVAKWQSSEDHDQWSTIHLEACSKWFTPVINAESSLIQLVYQQPGKGDRVYTQQV